jgi:diguanylate cyclase (GGDEF)-like protein/PAS domain S-box-containing protein
MMTLPSAPLVADSATGSSPEHTLWEMSLDLMAIASLDGRWIRLNAAWEQTFGYTAAELMSRPYLEFVHPEDVAATRAEASALSESDHRTVRFENRYRAKDGSYRWLSWSARAAPDRSCIYCVGRDVTAFHEVEAEREFLHERLREREQLLTGIVENSMSLIYVKDLDGRYLLYNQPFAAAFNLEVRAQPLGQSGRDVLLGRDDTWLDPELQPVWRANDLRAAEAAVHIQEWSHHPTRGRLTYDSIKFPLYDETGAVYATCGISRETTDRERALEHVQAAEERFRSAFQNAPVGMALTDLDGKILRANAALCEITGRNPTDLLQLSLQDITHPEDLEASQEELRALRAGEVFTQRGERRLFNASGHIVWVESSGSLVLDALGQAQDIIVQIQDISERKRLEERLHRLADVDSLTGIRNRRLFEEDLHSQIGRCQRYGEQAAMLMIDLDGFKKINDTYGHKAGDDMLKAVAAVLRRRMRTGDHVARLGGDEFGVLLANVAGSQVDAIAADFANVVATATVRVGIEVLSIRASVGIALIDEHAVDDEAVLAEADRSMYAAKRAITH